MRKIHQFLRKRNPAAPSSKASSKRRQKGEDPQQSSLVSQPPMLEAKNSAVHQSATPIPKLTYPLVPPTPDDNSSMVAPEILPDLVHTFSVEDEAISVESAPLPFEVTVTGENNACSNSISVKEDSTQNEITYCDMESSHKRIQDQDDETERLKQEFDKKVMRLTKELHKSRSQAAELLKHNNLLLEELKSVAEKDGANSDEHRMLKQELTIMKACLFFGAFFIWCGGRADVIGIVSLIWLVTDALSW